MYTPYGGALPAYRAFQQRSIKQQTISSSSTDTKSSSTPSLWGRFVKTIGFGAVKSETPSNEENIGQVAEDGTMLPLRDFLYPILGSPEGVFFCRKGLSTEFGVHAGDVLRPVINSIRNNGTPHPPPLGGASLQLVVIGSRSGCLWVTLMRSSIVVSGSDDDSGAAHEDGSDDGFAFPLTRPVVAEGATDLSFITNASELKQHYAVSDRCRPEQLKPLEPPSWWGDAVTSFLMFAPDLSLASSAGSRTDPNESAVTHEQRHKNTVNVILSPTVTLVGGTTILGWAGEHSAVEGEEGDDVFGGTSRRVALSWSAAVTIPPQ
ncbi:Hypothetical protein, putative [Bodo saltans]|uniref:Uncharacterized protein n=1 Tax=Bodo saltans TaxID=75058 RepID=A0A0S4JGF2_BODSA|nr:Hypothetical protein, putative [Bodo saltans]|eukprot:CUG90545.1 Hypothetical protein, putative [Bodo saltans]